MDKILDRINSVKTELDQLSDKLDQYDSAYHPLLYSIKKDYDSKLNELRTLQNLLDSYDYPMTKSMNA